MLEPGPAGQDPEEQARQGDRQALGTLLAEQAEPLRRWVERRMDHRLRGHLSASDIVQETCLAADRRLPHFGQLDAMPFGVWLRLLAGQRLAEAYRRIVGTLARDPARERPMDAAAGGAAELPGDITSPSLAAARDETAERVARALRALAPADREVLELRHFEGLSNDETAARLGLTRSAATKRYIRALERLRPHLEPLADTTDTSC